MDPMYMPIVLSALAALRGVLLAIAWITALFAKSPARRSVAIKLVTLLLTPPWRREVRNSGTRS
jgi:hypothetical protein